MPLTDTAVRHAKPRDKSYKMADMQGLYIQVLPSGGKHWKMKYRFDGREKKLSFGEYPRVSLRDARQQRDEARDLLSKGIDPAYEKRRDRLRAKVLGENTFTAISNEYCHKRRRDGDKAWAPATAKRCEYLLSLLDNSIGKMPIHEIAPIDVLAAVRKIEAKGKLESARRTLQLAGAVFRYAVSTARLQSDPTRDLRGALINPTVTHYGAITDSTQVGALLRAIDTYYSQGMTDWALKLAPYVFVRPGELRSAQWEEFDLEACVWTIPAEKTKMRKPHHVPLSRQSVALIRQIRSLTEPWSYLFPSLRSRKRPMSDNTLNSALRRMGYASNEMTAHGFRAMASKGREFAIHGLCRRLNMIKHSADRIFDGLAPETVRPERDDLLDAAAFLQAFMLNVCGAIDNLAHIWCAELPVTAPSGEPINRNEIGLRSRHKRVRRTLPIPMRDYLDQCSDWFAYIENYRDALAHRIPLYIPPQSLAPDDQVEFNRISSAWTDAVIARDWNLADKLMDALDRVGTFTPYFMHSFGEQARPMLLHGQLVCDLATIVEIGENMIVALDGIPELPTPPIWSHELG
ncbi:integrase arm-type DNA-binding domain-containing protein [Sphingopyxis sp. USTB-05]|uniref:tyrosine-type recombinase/integrase n=1 Tax=Sphingopyxis sp. USTB-05 TaxID=2830667 RepID=UPI002078562E|nr:integrase arm-type DNA-binding domain-containing protein [Sphingopyxis sp. USTB-05]USI75483.1 integrase arm-type DNA-binding domain-containing protein [Sphingopyxis sp. USTB-05]